MEIADPVGAVIHHKGHEVWTIAPNASVLDAIAVMASKNVGALLVMEGKVLCGLITERDYTRKVVLMGRASKDTPVRTIMNTGFICVHPADTVEKCMKIMAQSAIRHLPVVEDGGVIGVISLGDLVRWVMSAQKVMIDHLERYITGSYPV
jgi:CBS domain-containing protein